MVSPSRPRLRERIPAGFHLRDFGHIGHGTSGIQIGQDHLLAVGSEHIGAFGHKVNAAEDDVLRFGLRGDFGELVAVAGEIGKADDFVALIMVAEQDWWSQPSLARAAAMRSSMEWSGSAR